MNEMKCCRCCLEFKKVNTQFLLSSQCGEGTILELIQSVMNIEILDDEVDLPQQICSSCYTKFLTADEIRNKFLESDKILREWSKVSLIKVEESEDSPEITGDLEIEVIQNEVMEPSDPDDTNIYFIEESKLDFQTTEVTCCDYCGKVFTVKMNLLRHMRSAHLNKRFNCEETGCLFSFSTITNLMEHEMNAHGRKSSIQCSKCGQKFAYPSNLRYHHKLYPNCSQRKLKRKSSENSSKKPNLECEYCGKTFCHYTSKHRHVQTVHLKKRKFVCEYEGCNSSFGQKGHLLIHHRQHTGEKDHCSYCDFKCTTPSNMQKHIKNIHKIF